MAGGESGVINIEGKGKALSYRKVFSSEKSVSSAAGDGKTTFIATDRLVIRVKPGSEKAEGFFMHPKEKITGLAYDASAGVFYCTEKGVGFASKDGSLEFLKVSKPSIAASAGKLYVYLPDENGILEIASINNFKGLIKTGGVKNKK